MNTFEWLALTIYYLVWFVAVVTLISSVDDLIPDIIYVWRYAASRLRSRRISPDQLAGPPVVATDEIEEADLLAPPEKPVALLIPAWHEAGVIGAMLENTIRTLRYSSYHVFVGTYPNDAETGDEVSTVCSRYPQVHRVICADPGPTSKADCLNNVLSAILLWEKDNGTRFEIFAQHDSEDVVHPLSLKLYNVALPAAAMVQIPVFALEMDWKEFTGCHYIDEFCEHHIKNVPSRGAVGGGVPSAGVGTAFSRDTLERLGFSEVYNRESLTEDYEVSLRIAARGWPTRFIKVRAARAGGVRSRPRYKDIIATNAYFPARFWPAVRQKSRWILGIALQSWGQLGWTGGFWMRYMLLRDRKVLVTSQVSFLGYLVLGVLAVNYLLFQAGLTPYDYLFAIERYTLLWKIALADSIFLCWRLLVRVALVTSTYGPWQGFLSIPRIVLGNMIAFFATNRALNLYIRSAITKRPLAWEKTKHTFPETAFLSGTKRSLGSLLIDNNLIRPAQLEAALQRQRTDGRRLGEILVSSGALREEVILDTLATAVGMETGEVDPFATPGPLLDEVPYPEAMAHAIFPMATDGTRVRLATDRPIGPATVELLEQVLGQPVKLVLVPRAELGFAIEQGYFPSPEVRFDRRLTARLVEEGILTEAQINGVWRSLRRSYPRLDDMLAERGQLSIATLVRDLVESPALEGESLADYLLRRRLVTPGTLQAAVEERSKRTPRISDMLIERDFCSRETLDQIARTV